MLTFFILLEMDYIIQWNPSLRLQNTRYKNPQFVAQYCFVASFGSMFHVFHLTWSTCRTSKTCVADFRNLLPKIECRSSLSNKFWLCCSFFIKLTIVTQQICSCCVASWGFLHLVSGHLYDHLIIQPPPYQCLYSGPNKSSGSHFLIYRTPFIWPFF